MAKNIAKLRNDAVQKNHRTIERVNALMIADSNKILPLGDGMSQQELGGFYRSTITGLVDKWGNVNAAAAVENYNTQRSLWASTRKRTPKDYAAVLPPTKLAETSEGIIGLGMQKFMEKGFGSSAIAVQNALTRAVAGYNRDVALYNSARDSAVVRVQRVAEATACGFCMQMALFSVDGTANIGYVDYAVDFHNHCNCSIETIYEGDSFYRPDYYDAFEQAVSEHSGITSTPQVVAADIQSARRKGDLPAKLAN